MSFFGGKKQGPSIDELAGVILSEPALMDILQPRFKRKIRHITVDAAIFTLNFDDNEAVNAYILRQEDVAKFLGGYYGRPVIDVGVSESGHEQYLVRFSE
jgi:hypothetical protein